MVYNFCVEIKQINTMIYVVFIRLLVRSYYYPVYFIWMCHECARAHVSICSIFEIFEISVCVSALIFVNKIDKILILFRNILIFGPIFSSFSQWKKLLKRSFESKWSGTKNNKTRRDLAINVLYHHEIGESCFRGLISWERIEINWYGLISKQIALEILPFWKHRVYKMCCQNHGWLVAFVCWSWQSQAFVAFQLGINANCTGTAHRQTHRIRSLHIHHIDI